MFYLPRFTRTYLLRSAAIWCVLRVCIAAVEVIAAELARRPPPEHPFRLGPGAAMLSVAVVTGTAWMYALVAKEILLLGNLGYGRARVAALLAAPPAVLEIALGIVFT
jgi:hypothetical protein